MMRGAAVLGLAVLPIAGCNSKPTEPAAPKADAQSIACALDGADQFTRSCTVEWSEGEGRLTLIVRHPDGAFRRFEVVNDGRGVVAADGSEVATTALQAGELTVSIGDDRYRIPVAATAADARAKR